MENEKRLIDVEQAKRATYEEVFWSESEQAVVRHFLAKLPKVDAVEVVHARWIDVRQYCGDYMCSNCKELSRTKTYNYCPDCGAKMEGSGNA